jgi:energy-coupling factor transport system substrate-specific component
VKATRDEALAPRVNAILVGVHGRAVIAAASAVGVLAFGWPFFAVPGRIDESLLPPLLFGALLLIVVAVVLAELAAGGIDAKAVAMLGVLSALGAALRPLGAGTAGIETIFFVLIAAGRVFGPGFGFVLGCTTIFASALVTGGVGPWMPYQMFAAAWVGMGAGYLPPATRRLERFLLAGYGFVSAYAYGLAVNLSFWPFYAGSGSTIAYVPGAAVSTNVAHYLLFDATTSLGWDTGRALTNAVCLLVLGPALVAIFRRAARRAAFDAPVSFEASREGKPCDDAHSTRRRAPGG